MSTFVVLLRGPAGPVPYGPFHDEDTAIEFAEFLTAEVQPAKHHAVLSPGRELLSFWRQHRPSTAAFPDQWPPKPGDIWQDAKGDRWVCTPTPSGGGSYLTCLARFADDSAEEIWRTCGPMSHCYSYATRDLEEVPF